MLAGIYDSHTRISTVKADREIEAFTLFGTLTRQIRSIPLIRVSPRRTCKAEAVLLACSVALTGCIPDDRPPTLFELLDPKSTGVAFVNRLPERPELNIFNHLYYYNGGGVAAGDIDNDGLADLYFTSNLGPNRLYRNKGNFPRPSRS